MEEKEKKDDTIGKDLFQDIPVEERLQLLKDNAYAHEKTSVTRRYGEAEIENLKQQLSDNSVELAKLASEKAALTKKLDAAMKPLKVGISEATQGLRERSYTNLEEVFLMDDQEKGVMDVFDSEGKYLYSRRLYENERQEKMFTLHAAQQQAS